MLVGILLLAVTQNPFDIGLVEGIIFIVMQDPCASAWP